MPILNIAGYKFLTLTELEELQAWLRQNCLTYSLKGTILLSKEGINISLAGSVLEIKSFQSLLKADTRFNDLSFHETYSEHCPFRHLKVKIKAEIITFNQTEASPLQQKAPSISALELKKWLDEKNNVTLLDTRNDYEVKFGTFSGAVNLHIDDFSELPTKIDQLTRDTPIVMFCTGGIRCEKAALHMLNHGFTSVYQLAGGILGYFNQVGGAHYQGECFVFDERIAVDHKLQPTKTVQCRVCQAPVTLAQQALPSYVVNVSCPACA